MRKSAGSSPAGETTYPPWSSNGQRRGPPKAETGVRLSPRVPALEAEPWTGYHAGVRIIIFETIEERVVGLQHKRFIEEETLFVFPEIGPRESFHSQNVPEPFDIAFLDEEGRVLEAYRMTPPWDLVGTPERTALALEAKAGAFARWGIVNGSVVSIPMTRTQSSFQPGRKTGRGR